MEPEWFPERRLNSIFMGREKNFSELRTGRGKRGFPKELRTASPMTLEKGALLKGLEKNERQEGSR